MDKDSDDSVIIIDDDSDRSECENKEPKIPVKPSGGWLDDDSSELDKDIYTLDTSGSLSGDSVPDSQSEKAQVKQEEKADGELTSEDEDEEDEEVEDETAEESSEEETEEEEDASGEDSVTSDADLRRDRQKWLDIVAGRRPFPKDIGKGLTMEQQLRHAKAMVKSYEGDAGDSDYQPSEKTDFEDSSYADELSVASDSFDL